MTAHVNRHTKAPVRFVAGLSLVMRAAEDVYDNLEGRRLEALARLFAQNVRIYVYPMTATDLREWLKSASTTGWEWSETNGWVSASQLRHAPPLGHLFAYLLARNLLVPMRAPAAAGGPKFGIMIDGAVLHGTTRVFTLTAPISEATIQVLLAVGLDRLTTTRVAERAGVSVETKYHYYPNKQALLSAKIHSIRHWMAEQSS